MLTRRQLTAGLRNVLPAMLLTVLTLLLCPSTSLAQCATFKPVVIQNDAWYNQEGIQMRNTKIVTALTATIVIQKTPGVSYAGMWNEANAAQRYSDTGTQMEYTFTISDRMVYPGWEQFVAQTSGNGVIHPTAGDTYSITATCQDGTTSTASGTMGGDPTTFYSLTVRRIGTGTGTVTSLPAGINCGTDCQESYGSGTSVTLVAVPDPGSVFLGWENIPAGVRRDAGCGHSADCGLTPLTAGGYVDAEFTIQASSCIGECIADEVAFCLVDTQPGEDPALCSQPSTIAWNAGTCTRICDLGNSCDNACLLSSLQSCILNVLPGETPDVCYTPTSVDTKLSQCRADCVDAHTAPVDKYGQLEIKDGKLSSIRTGSPVQLKGMSLFWSNWGAAWWNESAVDQAVDYLGCQILRAPMAVGSKDGSDNPVDVVGGYLTDPDVNVARVRRVVDEAIYKGIYVIIDWHDHAAETHQAQAVEFFKEMAATYGNVPNVLFEIYNEPITTDWSGTIKPYAETVIEAIRSTNGKDGNPTQNVIIVGTPYYSQQVDKAADDPITDSPNIAYALHFYAVTHPLGGWQTSILDPSLAKGIALVVTEWGVCQASGLDPSYLPGSDLWLAWMDAKQISWTNWELFDKQPPESASMFKAGTSPVGPWSDTDLTDNSFFGNSKVSGVPMYYQGSGIYVKGKLPAPFTQFSASPSVLAFNFRGGTKTTTVTSQVPGTWTVTNTADWLTVSPGSGSSSETISITAAPYDSTTVDRTATIYLDDSSGHKAKVEVIQQYNDGNLANGQPTSASSEESPSYHAQYATDGDEANTRWSSASSDPQWIQVDLGDTYTIGRVVLRWEAAYSSSYHIELATSKDGPWTSIYDSGTVASALGDHTDDLTITSTASGQFIRVLSDTRITGYGNSLWEFEVYAAAASALSVSLSSWTPSGSGESGSIALTATGNWTASSSAPAWLTVTPTAGSGSATLTVAVNTNGTGSTRTGTVTITGPGGAQAVVTVTQAAASGSVLAPAVTALSVPAKGGAMSIAVNSNIQWWDYTEYSWLNLQTYSGSGNGTITLSPAANTTGAARTGTIIIQGNGVSTQKVTVTQAAQ